MNKDWILFHLREAQEELARTVDEIAADAEYTEGELLIALQHSYHHLNTAWNSRNSEFTSYSEQDFHQWRQFPTDLPLD